MINTVPLISPLTKQMTDNRIAEYANKRCSSGSRLLIVRALRRKDPAVVFGRVHFSSYPNMPSVRHAK